MPKSHDIKVGDALPERRHTATNVSLFLYNAVVWNAHRIHYDLPYTTEVEGYPGLVVAGPLLGDWLSQVVDAWIDGTGATLERFDYSNRQAAYVGDDLVAGGEVTAVDGATVSVDLFVKNADGDVIAPGAAVIRLA